MSNYSQVTAFTPKDSLSTGNPAKVIKGSDFDAEFAAISTAIISKADAVDLSNVNNTSDLNKPISTATQTALDAKVTGPASSTDNTIPRFDGTTGKLLQGSGVVVDDSGYLGVGTSTNPLSHQIVNYKGGANANYVQVANGATGLGASNGLRVGVNTAGNGEILMASSTVATIDASGNMLHNSGAFGYGAGAGGTVSQATSKSTAVTLNKPSGKITMVSDALAAGASISFVLSNSFIADDDLILLTVDNAAWGDAYSVASTYVGIGNVYIRLTNISAGSRSDGVPINFAVIKGSTT